jgi:hypothetical protein
MAGLTSFGLGSRHPCFKTAVLAYCHGDVSVFFCYWRCKSTYIFSAMLGTERMDECNNYCLTP